MSHKYRNILISLLLALTVIVTLTAIALSPFIADVNKLLGTPGGYDTFGVLLSTYATVFLPFIVGAVILLLALLALIIWLIVKTVAETKANRND